MTQPDSVSRRSQPRSKSNQLPRQLLAEQHHRARQACCQRDAGTPAIGGQADHVQLFLRAAIGLAAVPLDLALIARGDGHRLRELTDAQIFADADT